jgi:GNAT superfamily N-acetyltransferase
MVQRAMAPINGTSSQLRVLSTPAGGWMRPARRLACLPCMAAASTHAACRQLLTVCQQTYEAIIFLPLCLKPPAVCRACVQAAGYCVCAVTSLVAHVLKLVVAPGHRRRGVGTALMQVGAGCCSPPWPLQDVPCTGAWVDGGAVE